MNFPNEQKINSGIPKTMFATGKNSFLYIKQDFMPLWQAFIEDFIK